MNKHIPENAEVACKYPNLDMGTLERSVRFDVHPDQSGVSLTLRRTIDTGMHQSIHMRLQHALFAEILAGLARSIADMPLADRDNRMALCDAAETLHRVLADDTQDKQTGTNKPGGRRLRQEDAIANLTPEEEVLLLHVLE